MDSQAKIVTCLELSAADMQQKTLSVERLKNVIGLGLNEAIASLYPNLSDSKVAQFADRYRYHFCTANETPSALFDGVREMLLQLNEQGFMLAVATSKSRRGLNAVLSETQLDGFFHGSRCADETRSKPHPQMLQELLDDFAVTADEAIMIGDTEYDMLMAKSITMDALAVTYGVHEKSRILKHQPVACVDSVKGLTDWLQNCAKV
jgi:phosphoglycolate phosphatase